MEFARPALVRHPRGFGRGPVRVLGVPAAAPAISDDLKLFAGTFLVGFVFTSVWLF